ncbi:MAG: arsenate reductase ArsC [Acidobacteria bacterium]|nr:arsenate reductase ArsC [Acidobacteriota bacterium]
MNDRRKILFLCTGNSCRSQMAEGWLRHYFSDRYDAYSAGTAPGKLDPRAVKVMSESGVDISSHKSKSVDDFGKMEFDYVITVCDSARENCPFFPAKVKLIHKGFEDPPVLAREAKSEDEAFGFYQRVRDEIEDFILNIKDYLV